MFKWFKPEKMPEGEWYFIRNKYTGPTPVEIITYDNETRFVPHGTEGDQWYFSQTDFYNYEWFGPLEDIPGFSQTKQSATKLQQLIDDRVINEYRRIINESELIKALVWRRII
jgi:hypothetical protein